MGKSAKRKGPKMQSAAEMAAGVYAKTVELTIEEINALKMQMQNGSAASRVRPKQKKTNASSQRELGEMQSMGSALSGGVPPSIFTGTSKMDRPMFIASAQIEAISNASVYLQRQPRPALGGSRLKKLRHHRVIKKNNADLPPDEQSVDDQQTD